ncbi:unnamed protein product [Soboliphyme baturini]|uniref:Tyrosyl-DNA phosphodiesterase 1 n=1 Tax=Soboliphyme baturini TaxID=241478 RepID=A0A183I995_9BILA|nr:unnamed protein product [Soboliphyme baturini]
MHKRSTLCIDSDDDAETASSKCFKSLNDDFDSHYGLYLSTVSGIPDEYNGRFLALDIEDILSAHSEELEESAQFNYMIDIPWLISKYPEKCRKKPLLIVTGVTGSEWSLFMQEALAFNNITVTKARLQISYGTHHTKMMLLKCRTGLRVVIHTANLIEQDWCQKTQG